MDKVGTAYGLGKWYPPAVIVSVCLAVSVAVALFVLAFRHGAGVAASISLLPTALVLATRVYFSLIRYPYRLELDGDTLHWRSPLSHGQVPVRLLYAIERESHLRLFTGARRVLFRPFEGPTLALPQYLDLPMLIVEIWKIEPRVEIIPSGWAHDLGLTPSQASKESPSR
jgi:hypothetical protein